MKKFTFLAFTAILVFFFCNSFAQQKIVPVSNNGSFERCGTYQAMDKFFQQNPSLKPKFEFDEKEFQRVYEQRVRDLNAGVASRTNVIITIPVVVHIVLTNPNLVTDATVQSQIAVLNEDYAGTNPDAVNIVPGFQPLLAQGNLRFCLAQRTPANLPTNGIVRVTSGTTSVAGVGDPVKFTSSGGSDAWDPTRYLNVWVCVMQAGLLGYSFVPGTPIPLNERGFLSDYRCFGKGAAYLYSAYNLGRTATHEIGHFFDLQHTWGPNNCGAGQSCADDDGVADTPLQFTCHFGCPVTPGSVITDACSPSAPGIMYQNYMDYSDDACMLLFTPGQNTRMETAIGAFSFLTSLAASNACTPLTLVANDASISAIVTPANNLTTCDPSVPLTVTLRNAGSNALTSVTITVRRNAAVVQTYNWTGNLASTQQVNVPLNPVTLGIGVNAIDVCTSLPNGVPDGNVTNDCQAINVSRNTGNPLPLVEGFESATFPPTGWTRNNPDNGITWQRTTTGVEHGGIGKAFIDHFNYVAAGQIDELQTPILSIGVADSLSLTFWGAYKGYPGFPVESTQILVSTNCGGSYTTVYNVRDDTAFAIDPVFTTAAFFPSSLAQWKQKAIDLSSFIPSGNIIVKFRQVNNFGNNFHLDDINLSAIVFKNYDAGVIAINKPNLRECVSSGTPEVVIKNYGKIVLTTVKVNYQIDGGAVTTFTWNGSLPRNGTAVVSLPVANFGALGAHTIKAFTSLPNNVADENTANDTLTKAFTTYPVLPLSGSVVEGFNSTTFPPPGWIIFNPNNDMTWERNANVGKTAPGSAWFNDYNNATNNRIDDLLMPNFTYSGVDSIFLKFWLSTVTYSYPGTTGIPIDTLSVLLSKDCGNTFTTIYKKWGEELQTVNDPNFPKGDEFFPLYDYHWRLDSLNLGNWLGSSETQFQVGFRFHGNFENNIFLDDINLRTQILPAKLKTQGYLVLPNPFTSIFAIWHYQTPTNLKYINVYNSAGQLVWSKQYNSNAQRFIMIDLAKYAAGVYNVTLGYNDSNRNVIIPVIKL